MIPGEALTCAVLGWQVGACASMRGCATALWSRRSVQETSLSSKQRWFRCASWPQSSSQELRTQVRAGQAAGLLRGTRSARGSPCSTGALQTAHL